MAHWRNSTTEECKHDAIRFCGVLTNRACQQLRAQAYPSESRSVAASRTKNDGKAHLVYNSGRLHLHVLTRIAHDVSVMFPTGLQHTSWRVCMAWQRLTTGTTGMRHAPTHASALAIYPTNDPRLLRRWKPRHRPCSLLVDHRRDGTRLALLVHTFEELAV